MCKTQPCRQPEKLRSCLLRCRSCWRALSNLKLLFCPATPLLQLVKKGSAKMAPEGWFVSETWNRSSSPELRLCCKYLQVTCNQGLTFSVLPGSRSWRHPFCLTFGLKAEAVTPLSGCQGRRGRAGSSTKAGHWALALGGVRQSDRWEG